MGVTFYECLMVCAENDELVANFDRLRGTNLREAADRSVIAAMVDEATGRDRDAVEKFISFVWDVVWLRLPESTADSEGVL